MSSFVYGYIEPILSQNKLKSLSNYIKNSKLGIEKISKDWLVHYPDYLIPNDNIFTYLTSYDEYAPNIDIGFPTDPKERLDILINTLIDMIKITHASKMVVSINECDQIQTIKKIKFAEMRDVIHADFAKYQAPPDTLYEIICE
ncbi:hypothetical protein [Gilliamella apicola]|uniref:Uncharacterized protein n=1 Tax=Gilliamella apicola TaxID=1196095 RepID=A0A2V4DYY7_9GAMM|nr:hypothetical protein [Gilliamella apicola]PXZ04749.1 hypothetical protein DKK79_10430 [Gilliamella apicola]